MREIFRNEVILVGAILIVALMVIVYLNPPHTPCQSQVEVYDASVVPLAKSFKKAVGTCQDHTNPGGCVAFFEVLGRLEEKFKEVTPSCHGALSGDSITRQWITHSMELMVRAAWGSKPPASYLYRNGWLEFSQVVEFCRLRQHLENIFGKNAWDGFASSLMTDLPGSAELTQKSGRTEVWNRSLLSDPCNYPL